MFRQLLFLVLASACCLTAQDEPVVFKTDVSLSRIDTQVLDREGRAVTGLQANDFILQIDGKPVPIRNFANENMPVDILMLLDVSGSMQPHVQRIASAAQQALNVLAPKDRVAVMVFDSRTRVRLPFSSSHEEIISGLNHVLQAESFSGGTRITTSLLAAARYMQREARPDARRAIVVLTDDKTQDEEDTVTVGAALARANSVLSFLQAPYEVPTIFPGGGGRRRRGTWPGGGGGGYPGGGGGWPGGGWPGGGGGGPVIIGGGGGGYGVDDSHSAGTETIALESGGDTMQVEDASALEDTLARLRQRYALYYYSPDGSQPGSSHSAKVYLAQNAQIQYANAELRSRKINIAGDDTKIDSTPVMVTKSTPPARPDLSPAADRSQPDSSQPGQSSPSPAGGWKTRRAVNEHSEQPVNTTGDANADPSSQNPSTNSAPTPPQQGGWRRVNQPSPSQ